MSKPFSIPYQFIDRLDRLFSDNLTKIGSIQVTGTKATYNKKVKKEQIQQTT